MKDKFPKEIEDFLIPKFLYPVPNYPNVAYKKHVHVNRIHDESVITQMSGIMTNNNAGATFID